MGNILNNKFAEMMREADEKAKLDHPYSESNIDILRQIESLNNKAESLHNKINSIQMKLENINANHKETIDNLNKLKPPLRREATEHGVIGERRVIGRLRQTDASLQSPPSVLQTSNP